jgi:ABC-type lipoprotein export system ATPase subunit
MKSMRKEMCIVRNVKKTFKEAHGKLEILRNVSFHINNGEIVLLAGDSGSGKSTLLSIIGGLDVPNMGNVEIDGENILRYSEDRLADFRNKKIGFVFQFHHLLPDFSALENVMIAGLINGIAKKECRKRASEILNILGLNERLYHLPSELSGGERQRVAFARAVFNKPVLLLADEPTGNLDRKNTDTLIQIMLNENRERRQTMIIATHSGKFHGIAHRILDLNDGVITESDS